jgi:DNA polymerase-1
MLTYSIARTEPELQRLMSALESAPIYGFDVETYGPSTRWRGKSRPIPTEQRLVGFSVSVGDEAWYVPVRHAGQNAAELGRSVDAPGWAALYARCMRPRSTCQQRAWAFNLGFELQAATNEGFEYNALLPSWCDAAIAAWLAWGLTRPGLKGLASSRYQEHFPSYKETFGPDCDLRTKTAEEVAGYACKDPWLTVRVGEEALADIEKHGLLDHFRNIDMPQVEIARGMSARGVRVDPSKLEPLRVRMVADCDRLREDFAAATRCAVQVPVKVSKETGEFYKSGKPKMARVIELQPQQLSASVSSDSQVSRWLYDELKLWPSGGLSRNDKGLFPVDRETIEPFMLLDGKAGELARMRLEFQRKSKLVGTYLDMLLELPGQYADGKLHPSFHVDGTRTQRYSSSAPNFQNMPARSEESIAIRDAIRPEPGNVLVVYDLSQIELRILAHLSGAEALCRAYAFGDDVHADTLARVREVWPEATRTDSKIGNFSVCYNISAVSLAVKMRCSVDRAEQMIDAFHATYPEVRDVYQRKATAYLVKHGAMRTIDGFRRPLDNRPRRNKHGKTEVSFGEKNRANNLGIQGSAGGMIKIAMVSLLRKWVADGTYLSSRWIVGQVHDELIAECHADLAEETCVQVRDALCNAMPLRVPVEAEGGYGATWAEAKG